MIILFVVTYLLAAFAFAATMTEGFTVDYKPAQLWAGSVTWPLFALVTLFAVLYDWMIE